MTWSMPFRHLRSSLSPDYVSKELRTMLLGSIFAMNLFVLLLADDLRSVAADWLVNICAAAVVASSVAILYRQRFKGLYGRTYGVFAIGLMLWFSAEIIGTYEQYWVANSWNAVRGPIASISETFQPSIADALWLSGYGFLAYFLFRTMIHFSKSIKPRVLAVITLITAIAGLVLAQSIGYYLGILRSSDSASLGFVEALSLFFKIEYPILDVLLIIPSLVILSTLRHGKLTSTPWILLSTAIMVLAVGDIGNIYFSILGIGDNSWIWEMFGTAGYLCVATALFWYNRFFIFDPKKVAKLWQQRNR